jgi:GDP-L-fucose synthase
LANSTAPAQFLYDNLAIAANVIDAAADTLLEKLVFLGSSCIYPKFAEQPIAESALLSGPLEPTNECYAIAKIAGLKLCQAYRDSTAATIWRCHHLYGPGDTRLE